LNISDAAQAAASLLQSEVDRMRARGIPVGDDDLRGLYVSEDEADRIVGSVGQTAGSEAADPGPLIEACGERLAKLTDLCKLSRREAAALALCFVCENQPEIERLLGYVQDDVSKRRPRVELLLRLFWQDPVAGQSAFDAPSPLGRQYLVGLHEDAGQPATPLLARSISLDARIARYLAGGDALDPAIEEHLNYSPLAEANSLPGLPDIAALNPPALSLKGTDLERARRIAAGLAGQLGLSGVVEATLGGAKDISPRECFERAARDAALLNAALLAHGIDTLEDGPRTTVVAAMDNSCAPLTLLVSPTESPWFGPSLEIGSLSVDDRLAEFESALTGVETGDDVPEAMPALAAKFSLDTGAVAASVKTALGLATARDPQHPRVTVEDLYAAARSRSAPILSSLASKVTQHKDWDDLILEPDPFAQLHELCAMVEHRHKVYDEWGFGEKLVSGKGVVSLFAGQSGTGKTMGAGVIAKELGLDLYKIDLSGVVSKYIGETEKNLGAIFRDASQSNAILFFDEADALFGKRSEVRDAHDRYANIETAYLLQQIEEYSGPVILSTNLKMNLDEAFLRRMHFVVDFPMPEEPYRLRIWKTTMPAAVPLADDVDFAFLARQFKISGGNIRNIVLAAAFLAANEGDSLGMRHMIRATRREFQKLGRMVTPAEFGEHMGHLE